MKTNTLTRIGLTLGFASIILFAGCWTTKVSMIDPATAKVNLAFVGNWDNPDQLDAGGREAGLVIRNIDNKTYYVEWDQKGEAGIVRAVGYTTDIGGATFAQLRGLEQDGTIAQEWLICRVDVAGNKITIRQLNEEFLKTKTLNTPAAIRQMLEQNVNNEQLYSPRETITATKK